MQILTYKFRLKDSGSKRKQLLRWASAVNQSGPETGAWNVGVHECTDTYREWWNLCPLGTGKLFFLWSETPCE